MSLCNFYLENNENNLRENDSWEDAVLDQLEDEELKKQIFHKKYDIIKNFVHISTLPFLFLKIGIIKNQLNIFELFDSISSNIFTSYKTLNFATEIVKKEDIQNIELFKKFQKNHVNRNNDFLQNVEQVFKLFVSLNKNGIEARIYFVFGLKLFAFLEYKLLTIQRCVKSYDGFVISLDFKGELKNQSHVFSKSSSGFVYFCKIFDSFLSVWNNVFKIEKSKKEWLELDECRNASVPKTLEKLKMHPFLTCEKFLKTNQIIFSKRKAYGKINLIDVYNVNNIHTIYSDEKWTKLGYKVDADIKPFKISNRKKLYADFQVVSNYILDFDGVIPDKNLSNLKFTEFLNVKGSVKIDFPKIFDKAEIDKKETFLNELCLRFSTLQIKIIFFIQRLSHIKYAVKGVFCHENDKEIVSLLVSGIYHKFAIKNFLPN